MNRLVDLRFDGALSQEKVSIRMFLVHVKSL